MQKSKEKDDITLLAWLCWLVYTFSYLGKVNYSANITQIERLYGITHAEAGMANTLFFFAYGVGQIVNGILCKKYNIKYTIFGALLVTGVCNFLVAFAKTFTLIKILWLINGAALSVLWPTLVRLLSENAPKERMTNISVLMGTTVATGTLSIYGLSAFFAVIDSFKLSFLLPAFIIPVSGVLWLCFLDKLTRDTQAPVSETVQEKKGGKLTAELFISIAFLAVAAVATNLIKDGLTAWLPSILNEQYSLPDFFSILLTLALPAVAIFGNLFAVTLHKKIPDFVLLDGVLFLGAGGLLAVVIVLLGMDALVITLLAFVLVNALVSSSNSLITSIFPLLMKGKLNSGLLAGVLNGFCYLGSTISAYGLGAVADKGGWTAVFYLLLAVCIAITVLAIIYAIVKKVKTK